MTLLTLEYTSTKYRVVPTFKNTRCNQTCIYYGTLLILSKKRARYRQAIAKLRCSFHTLMIERGRHTNPKAPVADRKYSCCAVIEDEKHFLLICVMNMPERDLFYKIARVYDGYMYLNLEEKVLLVLTNNEPQCLFGLVIFSLGPLRKEICAQSIHTEPTSGHADGYIRVCTYICISVPQW